MTVPSIEKVLATKPVCFKGEGKECEALVVETLVEKMTQPRGCQFVLECRWSGRMTLDSGTGPNGSTLPVGVMEGGRPIF